MHIRFIFATLLATTMLALPLAAQVTDPTSDRVDRLERDIMLMQKQLARSGVNVATSSSANQGELAPSADTEVRLTSMEESMRDLQGKVEENDFQVRQMKEMLEKFQKDTEFRFNELSQNTAPAGNTATDTLTSPEKPVETTLKPRAVKAVGNEAAETDDADTQPTNDGQTTAGDGVLRVPEPGDAETFDTPRDLYNYAFRLLNQTRYEEAAQSFGTFTKKYPKDPLVGNAYYWQGETFYIRRDYVNAADAFRQGFESLPNGPKAPDNLLKLAMSLDALDRGKEACIVLGQITTKFKKTSVNIVDKAAKEQKRMGCNN
ncbi:MAG: tol-pal system protein YbgF [Alphaproteobacteria bacterium]